MNATANISIDQKHLQTKLKHNAKKMKTMLTHCVRCSLCAESCFLYMKHDKDPKFMPSYKVIHSLGKIYKKRGKVTLADLKEMKGIVWKNCVLCRRCYCPIGVNIPELIGFARSLLRDQGIFPLFDNSTEKESWL